MAHTEDHVHRSPEQELFYEYLKNGDDFSKIEIYRLAKYWYLKALETGVQPELMKSRIEDLNKKIAFERKTIIILAIIATAIFFAVFFNPDIKNLTSAVQKNCNPPQICFLILEGIVLQFLEFTSLSIYSFLADLLLYRNFGT